MTFLKPKTLTRSRTISSTNVDSELLPVLLALYRRARRRRAPVRLLGVALSNLVLDDRQLHLFGDDTPRWQAVDIVRARYGYDAIRLAASQRIRASPAESPANLAVPDSNPPK